MFMSFVYTTQITGRGREGGKGLREGLRVIFIPTTRSRTKTPAYWRGRSWTTRAAKIKKSTIIMYGHNLHTTGRWALYA